MCLFLLVNMLLNTFKLDVVSSCGCTLENDVVTARSFPSLRSTEYTIVSILSFFTMVLESLP